MSSFIQPKTHRKCILSLKRQSHGKTLLFRFPKVTFHALQKPSIDNRQYSGNCTKTSNLPDCILVKRHALPTNFMTLCTGGMGGWQQCYVMPSYHLKNGPIWKIRETCCLKLANNIGNERYQDYFLKMTFKESPSTFSIWLLIVCQTKGLIREWHYLCGIYSPLDTCISLQFSTMCF